MKDPRRTLITPSRLILTGALCAALAASCSSNGNGGMTTGNPDLSAGGGGDGGTNPGGGDGGTSGGDGGTSGGDGGTSGGDGGSSGGLSLTAVSPVLGPSTGNVPITLTGTGFSSNTAVSINGVSVTPTSVSATQLTFTLPQQLNVKGKVPIRLLSGGNDVTRADLFAYYYGRLEFDGGTKITVGNGPYWVALDDFDKDGKPDLAVSLYFGGQVAVLRGQGSGAFAAPVPYAVAAGSPRPTVLAIADINKDTYPDLITANYQGNNVSAIVNRKDGTFAPAVGTATGVSPNYVVAQDVTGDGYADAVVANTGATSNDFQLLRGKSDGSLSAPVGSLYVDAVPSTLTIADVDKDGKLDLLLGNMNTGRCTVMTGDGTGTFTKKTDVFVGSQPWSFATADMDGDGSLDLISSLNLGNGIAVLLGTGTGSFGVAKKADLGANSLPSGIALADFDADQKPDVAAAVYGLDQIAVLRNTGAGNLGTPVVLSNGVAPRSVAIGDVNADGKPDLISANSGDNTITVFLNKSQ